MGEKRGKMVWIKVIFEMLDEVVNFVINIRIILEVYELLVSKEVI